MPAPAGPGSAILLHAQGASFMREPVQRPSFLSAWDLLPALGFLALALFYQWLLPSLPDPVPVHFDALGRANGWMPKQVLPLPVFGVPLLLYLAISGTTWLMARWQPDPAKARVMSAQPLRGLLGLGITGMMAGGLAIPRYGMACLHGSVALLVALCILGTVLALREAKDLLGGQSDASSYRWGLLYVNPQDPRLWVEKRLGVGWTLNFAHPAAGWVTLLLFLPVVVLLGVLILGR